MASGTAAAHLVGPTNGLPLESAAILVSTAMALGASSVNGWSKGESALASSLATQNLLPYSDLEQAIHQEQDPLGELFCQLLASEQRRPLGATYTPPTIVNSMLEWAAGQLSPNRVVDPGTGSARFLVAAGRRFPHAELIGIELDPLAAILARGHLAAAGMAKRAQIIVGDYRDVHLPKIAGQTLFAGNPPYVRHHLLGQEWKQWLANTAWKYGLGASRLAGLHVYFFLATAEMASPHDVGVFITAAEWLDVNYGQLVRELLLNVLGLKTMHVIEPEAMPFPGTATTAVITGFEVGARPKRIGLRRVAVLGELAGLKTDRHVRRERLEGAHRWTPLTRAAVARPEGFVELGELCRVHRGQVTGANRVWIAGPHSLPLPESVLFASVTRARELFSVDGILADISPLRRVIDLPADLGGFGGEERQQIERFLKFALSLGADRSYIARHRKAWWSVGLRDPAPILATYMARRPPAFVRNVALARHINIAHGLYPREPLDELALVGLCNYLSRHTRLGQGRTYAGGLTKFEPREMERLIVPHPVLLKSGEWAKMIAYETIA